MKRKILAALPLLLPASGMALTTLDESELSGVSGQSGITAYIDSPGITATYVEQKFDPNVTSVGGVSLAPTAEATMRVDGLSLKQVNATGTSVGTSRLTGYNAFDFGSDATRGGAAFKMHLDRARLRADRLRHMGQSDRSFGTWVLDSPVDLELRNMGGLLNSTTTNAYLKLELAGANLFYRQLWHQHPYLILKNLDFVWEVPSGTVGVDSNGLLVSGDTYFKINFDAAYKFPVHSPAETEFITSTNDRPMLNFGWDGGLDNATVRVNTGGLWYGTTTASGTTVYNTANKSGGIGVSLQWNYYNQSTATAQFPEFKWNVGEGDGNRVRLEFGDWRNLTDGTTPVPWGFDFPTIALDVINNGQGPGGLCWGSPLMGPSGGACSGTGRQFVNLAPGDIQNFDPAGARTDAKPIALAIRDGNLLSYSNSVRVKDDTGMNRLFQWGLIYTLANVNANIYLYSGGNPSDPTAGANGYTNGSRDAGLIADILLMTQTFDETGGAANKANWLQSTKNNWKGGSHFLIADTNPAVNLGIGLLSASMLLSANDTRILIRPNWTSTDNYASGIDLLSRDARINLKGLLGGGDLYGASVVPLARANLNLEGLINLRLSPAPVGQSFLAFSGAFRLGEAATNSAGTGASGYGSFFALEEPSRAGVELRIANVTGDLAMTNGKIDLIADNTIADRPLLRISTDIQVGQTAIGRVNDSFFDSAITSLSAMPLSGDVRFGNLGAGTSESLGKMVINAGSWNSTLTLKPKTAGF